MRRDVSLLKFESNKSTKLLYSKKALTPHRALRAVKTHRGRICNGNLGCRHLFGHSVPFLLPVCRGRLSIISVGQCLEWQKMIVQALAVPIWKRVSYQRCSTVFTIALIGVSVNDHTIQMESIVLPGYKLEAAGDEGRGQAVTKWQYCNKANSFTPSLR